MASMASYGSRDFRRSQFANNGRLAPQRGAYRIFAPAKHKTRETFKAAKVAEAIALKILDAEVGWLVSTRATTIIGLKLKASYTSMEGKLADSIVEDLLQL